MTDSTVVTSVSYPDAKTLALVADVQYHEPYSSAAINRKFRGILNPGFYSGFDPQPGGGLSLLITSADSTEATGTASVDIGDYYQVTVRQQLDVTLTLSAGVSYAIILKAVYEQGTDTYQVNSSSATQAAQVYAKTYTDSYTLSDGELLICTVVIPADSTEITSDMIDTADRISQSIGITLSDDIDSDSTTVAASSNAVKKAIASLMGSAPETLSSLALLAAAINNDPDFYETVTAALDKKMSIAKNGADIADTSAFLENLGISESFFGRLKAVQHFSASGTYTKTDGTQSILVIVQGAGGAGGYASACATGYMSGGAGGGAGGYAEKYLTSVPDSAAVVVGAGGTATASSAGSGGQSSFNGSIIAYGGGGGGANASTVETGTTTQQKGGSGGSSTGGDINGTGQMGGWSLNTRTGNSQSGFGAASKFSGGGFGQGGGDAVGAKGNLGSGGSGALGGSSSAATSAHAGGNGGDGFVRIYEFA